VRQDAVTRDRRYGPLMAKRSEGRKEGVDMMGCHVYAGVDYRPPTAKHCEYLGQN